jgi:hypothetical protein
MGELFSVIVQPIEKKALEKRFGRFSDEEWERIVAHLLTNVDRPDRPEQQDSD